MLDQNSPANAVVSDLKVLQFDVILSINTEHAVPTGLAGPIQDYGMPGNFFKYNVVPIRSRIVDRHPFDIGSAFAINGVASLGGTGGLLDGSPWPILGSISGITAVWGDIIVFGVGGRNA
jgi:hypothetical protein